ncbi:chaperonin [Theileria orientalis strain Shintoku]|uniref:Chaperonin n=2 Tax=Theileria orientalis TaxID=68886 RepID=J7MET0_THEOR|nr:chaperonin [Theileria orientalis strain Shintoku]PVC54228.1 chaperonin [Theileria orientalis]UKJ87726.1 chaperonin [Theileria orientalis]BAM38709.1 chaperonin [Theileria orientalis strain Shintoku]|eukprot:XP_009689010.1 chaperonin [Theileria orientalis strain Shintoku]
MTVARRFVPLFDRVLVSKIKPEHKTKSGILLPDSANLSSRMAKVVAVGAGRHNSKGELVAPTLKVGDTVVIPEYGGMDLKFEGEVYTAYREEDIIGTYN